MLSHYGIHARRPKRRVPSSASRAYNNVPTPDDAWAEYHRTWAANENDLRVHIAELDRRKAAVWRACSARFVADGARVMGLRA